MRICHFSDLHIVDDHRLADQAVDLARLVDAMIAARPELALLTGDLYGRIVPHRPTPNERAVLEPQIVRLANVCPVVIVGGNHDHTVALERAADLRGHFPVTVATTAVVIDVPHAGGIAHVYALPYPTKAWLMATLDAPPGVDEARRLADERLATILRVWSARMKRTPDDVHILAAHIQVGGAMLAGGEVPALQEIEVSRAVLAELPIAYGALGHIHIPQEVVRNVWYAGPPWPTDFSESPDTVRGFVLVDAGPHSIVRHVRLTTRPWLTLDWRWAADRDDGAPRWVVRPSFDDDTVPLLELVDSVGDYLPSVRGARVRARFLMTDATATSCPWAGEVSRLERMGAYEVKVERRVEPTQRVRAPMPTGETLPQRLDRYWSTLSSPPLAAERDAALEALATMQEAQ